MFIISPKKVTSRREQKATLGGIVGVPIAAVSGGVEHTFITEEGEESPVEFVVQPRQSTSHEPDKKIHTSICHRSHK